MIPISKRFFQSIQGVLALTILAANMFFIGCGPTEQKEVPPQEKEEMRQQLKDMSNREQSGK